MPSDIAASLARLDAQSPLYATELVDALLAAAIAAGASDVHLHPTADGLSIRWRLDGVLHSIGEIPRGQAADVVARLKVLAELLTYKTDVPQEGRIRRGGRGPGLEARAREETRTAASPALTASPSPPTEMRVSSFPTLHGERAVVRLFAAEEHYQHLADLGLPAEIEAALKSLLYETSGAILISGPAGSGKTTTAYACLREVIRSSQSQRSVVTLEDPIEVALPGVSQSQVQPAAGFTLAAGLRSLMRQDPEVILVGEIRDAETVATVFQAALTGHLVLSTLHAGSASGSLSRLLDMGLEPYTITSGLRAAIHQRLVRRLCDCRQATTASASDAAKNASHAAGCPACRHTGYRGRLALAEMLPPLAGDLAQAVLAHRDQRELTRLALAAGMTSVHQRAAEAVAAGQTDEAETRRVLGLVDENTASG
jgi:type II secretory ATPase GspE/PulE/Tfp pilus assembly ATPase PilB-like protein